MTSHHLYGIFGVVSYTDHSVTRTRHFLIKSDQSIIAIVEIGVIFTGRNSNGLIVGRINRGLVFGEFYSVVVWISNFSRRINMSFFATEDAVTTGNNMQMNL
jgi:hypothetical protein